MSSRALTFVSGALVLSCGLSGACTSTTPAPEIAVAAPQEAAPKEDERWTQAELESISADIMDDIEDLRDEEFLRPVAVKVSSKEELIAYIKMREEKTTPPERFAADEMVAKLLAVIPHDMDLRARAYAMLEAQVGGFYDPDTDSFSLMEWVPRGLTKIILAHELDHALDDQLFDIDGTLEKIGSDTDPMLSYHAVVEGSGTAVMTQWMLKFGDPKDMASLSESQMKELLSMADAPDWLWKPLMAAYTVGSAFLGKTDNWMTAGTKPIDPDALRTAFEKPPRSTEQVLHPDKYWKEDERDEPRRVAIDAAKLEEGWSVLREDTLGEIAIAIVTTPPSQRNKTDFTNPMAVLGIQFTNDASTGWDGDRLVLLGKGDARVLRWVTVWDGENDAGEFHRAMTGALPELDSAAKALSGGDGDGDGGASVEYGETREVVLVTVHARTPRSDLEAALRPVKHAIE